MNQPKITHTNNTKKEEIGHGLGGTTVLDGTGRPCQFSALTCLKALTCTVWKGFMFRRESGAIGLDLVLNRSGKGYRKEY